MSSQFQEECSAAPGRFFMETWASSGVVRMNLALAPTTLTTGWSPIVLVTTPPHPASNARRMLLSDSVGGAEESRKGFSKSSPVNLTDRLADMADSLHSRHLKHAGHPDACALHHNAGDRAVLVKMDAALPLGELSGTAGYFMAPPRNLGPRSGGAWP